MYDDALTQDERDEAHSSVRVDVLCVENTVSDHVVIGVGYRDRATSPRKHNQLLNTHF